MAHEAGRDASAKRHFGRALALVQVGGDQQLTAHILGSMSHLASYLGAPDEAIGLARQGQAAPEHRTSQPRPRSAHARTRSPRSRRQGPGRPR